MKKEKEGIKKQFTLDKKTADFIDLVAKKNGITNSQIASNAIEIYLNLFYNTLGNSEVLGIELKKICESGGSPWNETIVDNFSGEVNYEQNIEKKSYMDEKEVVRRACSLFTRLYREGLVSKIELKAKEMERSSFAAVCEMIRKY